MFLASIIVIHIGLSMREMSFMGMTKDALEQRMIDFKLCQWYEMVYTSGLLSGRGRGHLSSGWMKA